MLSDGIKAKEAEQDVHTYDTAEILEKSIFGVKNNAFWRKQLDYVKGILIVLKKL
jgi:hypothetical protein